MVNFLNSSKSSLSFSHSAIILVNLLNISSVIISPKSTNNSFIILTNQLLFGANLSVNSVIFVNNSFLDTFSNVVCFK